MNRNNIYTVNPLYNGSTTQATGDDSVQSGGTTIIYQQGGGTGLTDAQKQKLDGIQEGAEVNQNAYSKVRLNGSDTLIIEAKNKTDILNMSGVYPIAIAINGSGGLDFTVSSDQTNTNAVVTQSQLQAAIEKLQEDKYWKVDEDGKLYTELDVYSHKEISAYGAGTGGGSTGGAGALYECADVLRDGDKVQGAAVGSILSYNGSHWYAIPQSAITPDLTNYATKSYVTQQINDLIGGAPGTLDTLKEIAEALGNNPNFATTVTEMINNIGLRVDQVEDRVVSLEDMFEWDKSASASDPSLWRIKAKKDLYGVGEISAYGYSSGTVPTGAQYMYELKDVLFTELTSGQLLQWNGTKWINIDKNAVGLNETELAKYLTNNNYAKKSDITWANLLNKPTTWGWASITGKPTTLAGYGITDGVSNTRRVSAGSGLAGGGVLSSDVTISLGTIGTAGTYTKITTDMYGRVVSGTTLSESDIPTLQISKISGLQSALNSKLNISDFNTWFTIKKDSQGRIVSIQANYDFFSVGEISAYGLGETQPSVTTLAGLDDVTITSPANGQTLIYDSATSQWKNGTIIGGGNISLNGTVYKPVNGTITLPNLATPGDITTALNGYATQAWVTDKNYATQSWVNGKGYVTATALATMGFATRTWVNSQGFLKSNSLDNYVTLNTIQNITAAKTFQGGIVSTTFRKSDGTSSQFLKADGSVDSNIYALAYGGSQQQIFMSRFLNVVDRRNETIIPSSMEKGVNAYFTMQDTPYRNWRSTISVKGWSADYATWELTGPSHNDDTKANERLYYRYGFNSSWKTSWKPLAFIEDITTIGRDNFVLKTGDTMTGDLHAPTVWANTLWATSTLRSNLLLTVGASNNIVVSNRAELHLITPSDNPSDLWMGANNSRRWSITARGSGENYQLGIYNNTRSNWNVIFRDDINDFYAKTEVRSTFLVVPSNIAGGYNEGIRVCNGSNNWSNIQFGAQNAWNGMINGQWVVGKNPANCFQVCMAGTETANTTRPSKGFSVDTNGYLHTGYISVEINTDNQGDYFYSSNDAFLRRSAWYAALSHLSNKQRILDLTSLDQNKWYPCIIEAPAYGGTPLRITLFNGLRGNKPTWGSHQQGFSLLLDYEVIGSGWGTLAAIAKLNWYFGGFGGETAFGGRQQNTMASTEIIYLRGGGIYYYRTTNGQQLTVQPNGYTWSSSSYNYSAPVKTSQDNSPMEKTFDQVYWAPNNLRNTRTIWGQSFNGSQNVSGALSGATTITATGDITTSANIGGRSINAGADLTVAGYTYCNGRLYVDRGRFSTTAAPAISLAIGDTDTGFHWYSDGAVQIYSNSSAVGMWTGSEFRYGHGYFKQASGNDYHTLGIMVNGNGTANTIKPGIGFHQPGVYAGSIRMNDGSSFGIYSQGGTALANLSLNGWYTNYGYINGDGLYLTSGWFRAHGTTGWYNQTYGGGMYMTDTVYVRTYNNKRLRAEKLALGDRDNDNNARYITCYGMPDVSYINFGYTPAGGNCGELSFGYTASGGPSNYIGLGFYGSSGANLKLYYNSSSILIGSLSVNGNMTATGEVTAYSDVRLKSNIQPLKYRGRLTPKTYIKDNKQSIGFIAQEVQILYPETVLMSDDKEHYLSLNYNALTAVLAAQLNDVDDEVTLLKKRVEFLEKEVKRLSE